MFALLLAAALATAECPPTADGSVLPSRDADWLIKPDADDVAWAYPPKARIERLTGRATISCEVSIDGILENCAVIAEDPEGHGFGEGAVSLTSRMRMRPAMRCGRAERGEVRIPIAFSLLEGLTTPPEALPDTDPRVVAAKRLLEALHMSTLLERSVEQQAFNFVVQERAASADERKAVFQAATETKEVVHDALMASYVQTAARTLTVEEMEQAIAFYQTPVGAKLAWGGGLLKQIWDDAAALRPSPFTAAQRRFCELSPKSCEAAADP